MSSQSSSRLLANAYPWYDNENGASFDFISQPSHPFSTIMNERAVVDPWLQSDGILTRPNSSMIRFPRPHMQLIVFRNNLANNTNLRSRPTRGQDFELNPDEQKKAIMKLKKEIYNPIPKKMIQRVGRFYSQNSASKTGGSQKKTSKIDENDGDSYASCVICLEEFESKQVVMVTPCDHMFHEDCILPWVKSHGKCPVCRFSFTQTDEPSAGALSTNTDNSLNDRFTYGMISFVTSMDSSSTIEPFRF